MTNHLHGGRVLICFPDGEPQTSDLQPSHVAITSVDSPSSRVFVLIDLLS
jgi:hypothetical protein